jgi:hemerythrin
MRTATRELIFFEIEEMASEHRQILEGFAQLAAVPESEFAAAYGRLLEQIEADFRAEESIMEKICYPDLRNHLRDHASLLGILHKARPYIDEGDMSFADMVRGTMPLMLVHHMTVMDMTLADAIAGFVKNEVEQGR